MTRSAVVLEDAVVDDAPQDEGGDSADRRVEDDDGDEDGQDLPVRDGEREHAPGRALLDPVRQDGPVLAHGAHAAPAAPPPSPHAVSAHSHGCNLPSTLRRLCRRSELHRPSNSGSNIGWPGGLPGDQVWVGVGTEVVGVLFSRSREEPRNVPEAHAGLPLGWRRTRNGHPHTEQQRDEVLPLVARAATRRPTRTCGGPCTAAAEPTTLEGVRRGPHESLVEAIVTARLSAS